MRKLVTLIWSLLLVTAALSAQDYIPLPLQSLGAGNPNDGTLVAVGINDSGVVVGTCLVPATNSEHACYWMPNGKGTDIGTLGGPYSAGLAINNQGQIVGYANFNDVSKDLRAFIWSPGAGMKALPHLVPGSVDMAEAINNNGAVAGYSCLGSQCTGAIHAFLWTSANGMKDLGTLPGGGESDAFGINSANHVVGTAYTSDNRRVAFIWRPTAGMVELAPSSGLQNYSAAAINDSDQVVGSFNNPTDNQLHAFLWTEANGLKDLGVLPSGGFSEALAINKSGDVAGFARDVKGVGYAVIWRQGGAITELGKLSGIALGDAATGINTSGEISANSLSKPYLLKPTFVQLSPKSLNFGAWPVGQTSTVKSITVTNLGRTTLTINSIKVSGVDASDFSETNTCGSSLAAGANCVINVAFKPEATGVRTATVYVTDSDSASPQHASLVGSGN